MKLLLFSLPGKKCEGGWVKRHTFKSVIRLRKCDNIFPQCILWTYQWASFWNLYTWKYTCLCTKPSTVLTSKGLRRWLQTCYVNWACYALHSMHQNQSLENIPFPRSPRYRSKLSQSSLVRQKIRAASMLCLSMARITYSPFSSFTASDQFSGTQHKQSKRLEQKMK